MEYILYLCTFSICKVNGPVKIGISKECNTRDNKELYTIKYQIVNRLRKKISP